MSNKKSTTKKALFASVVSLLLCFTMLIGTTFAWFTDTVTSAGNIIKSGTLDVTMEWAEGTQDPNATTWTDASQGAIFNYDLWEPGFTEVRHIKIANVGSLALKYQVVITANGVVSDLADVIDVYYIDPAQQIVGRTDLANMTSMGTLTNVLGTMNTTASGELYPAGNSDGYDSEHMVTIALKMQETAGNEYQNKSIGTDFSVQLIATQHTYEEDSFDDQYDKDSTYPVVDTMVTAANLATIDFTEENTEFVFTGAFDAVSISELGNGSVIALANATISDLTLGDDATVTGTGALNTINTTRNSAEAVTLNITDATLDIAGELGVRNTDNKSILNIENSIVNFGTIYVGGHTNNQRAALAEFNVINSFLSGEENGLGSTINVWGRSGVASKIYDSEIYTYSRGWHQSEDANDNAITFQGATSIDVDIQRSNMHLYGARSIINARQYGSEDTSINFTIDESLIWSVTKSSHAETTLPVWGATEITDSILLFTKNVYQSTDTVFTSFVYGNPVIHGEYHVTTQCQWDADISLADGQTVTFAADADVSIYEGAGNVKFVLSGSAKVVLEDGAKVTNIGGLN